ncbi:MAG: PAS domain-containing protein [Rhizobiales bacterium]|nr:PAS domain-containing protein [Hyphomicrobiales bacterium]
MTPAADAVAFPMDLRFVVDALPNPLVVLDAGDRVVAVNTAAEDFFQASSTVLTRLGLAEIVPFSSPALQSVRQVRESVGVVNEYAIAMGTPRLGGERIVDLQTAPIGDDGRFVMMMLLRRSMAHKFDLQLSHQGAARSVSGMAAMLAHEIKNPLAGIRGAAQLLEPALGDADRSLVRLICDETDRIRQLVDQMEVFSDERPLERRPVNIHVVLDRVKQLMVASGTEAIVIREDYDPSLPAVHGSSDQLVQVFLNLAKNAVEAMRQQGPTGELLFTTAFRPGVRLSVAGSSERISLPLEVCVHDTGPGVPDELLPHIFEPFVSSKRSGRGLGLALVAKIVRDHGGVVECKPRQHKGTTFRVLLPLTPATENAPLNLERS